MRAGVYLYGIASIAAGIINVAWGNFEPAHQPIQAFGDHIPGQRIFAYLIAVCLMAGGAAILRRRTAEAGAVALGLVYSIFAVFWLPRFYTAAQALGFRILVFVGVLGGVAQQMILVAGAVILYGSLGGRTPASRPEALRFARWIFGLGSINFGLQHFNSVKFVAAMVPKWMPFGGGFWAVVTGVAFVLAGVAILSRVLDVLAAQFLALMLLMFSILALAPLPFASPLNHIAWGSNAYNLAAVGSVWLFAALIPSRTNLVHQSLK
jgi:uncharacterized membrane protein